MPKDKKVDKPSDADFVKAMTDNMPGGGKAVRDFLTGYIVVSAINGRKSK